MDIRITDIRNFIEASEAGSLSEAARRLNVTQPTLSESILRFEKILGKKVFYRTRLGVKLTPFGRDVLERARATLFTYNDLGQMALKNSLFGPHPIRIGCHPVVGSYVLPKALSLFSKDVDHFKFKIVHGRSAEIQEMVQNGTVDIALVVNPRPVPDLIISEIAKDKVSVWRSMKHNCPHRLICNPNIFQTQTIIRRWKRPPTDIVETDNLELIARLTEAGLGFGILPQRAVELVKAKIKQEINLPQFSDSVGLIYRPEFGKLSFERQLIDAIKNVF